MVRGTIDEENIPCGICKKPCLDHTNEEAEKCLSKCKISDIYARKEKE